MAKMLPYLTTLILFHKVASFPRGDMWVAKYRMHLVNKDYKP